MEEGSLRAEANISVRPVGTQPFGTKTEVKNVASFSGTQKAIEYEIARQIQVLTEGGTVTQETRGWDADRGVTFPQRTKESAHDYRYFPEPDLVPIIVDEAWERRIAESLPELPRARWMRFQAAYGLSAYDAQVLTSARDLAGYFEASVEAGAPAKQAANWIMGDVQALMIETHTPLAECRITPPMLAQMIGLIEDGTISGKIAKDIVVDMFLTGKSATALVEEKGLVQISDTGALQEIVHQVVADNPGPAEDYRNGKKQALGFLMGQIMKASQGKANPKVVSELLKNELENA
jgi:aspartyl-tRNA(Asn)/glutamyl-tRNA(Gln) amidotransferase subunit B